MMSLTNCTFDGIVYDVQRVMEECLAIKPDLVFLWDEAWFAFARFHPVYRNRTAMASAAALRERLQDPDHMRRFEKSSLPRPAMPPATMTFWTVAWWPTRPGHGCGRMPPSPRTRR